MAICMYINNCGIFELIARILKTSPTLVLYWIKRYAKNFIESLENKKVSKINGDNKSLSQPDIIEMDEIFTYIKKNKSNQGLDCLL